MAKDNNNNRRSVRQINHDLQVTAKREIRGNQNKHFHKDSHGPCLIDASELKLADKKDFGLADYDFGDDDYVCEKCGEVINMTSVTEEEYKLMRSIKRRMINQSKILCSFEEKDADAMVDLCETSDELDEILWSFYDKNVIQGFADKNKKRNNNNNNQRSKGNGSVNIPMNFNRR